MIFSIDRRDHHLPKNSIAMVNRPQPGMPLEAGWSAGDRQIIGSSSDPHPITIRDNAAPLPHGDYAVACEDDTMRKSNLILAMSLAITAAPGFASDGNWRVGNDQIHVVDHTIDVATPAGRAALLVRIEKAAEMLCRDRVGGFRETCEVETVRETARGASNWSRALAVALRERAGDNLAAN
jgi:UrcA family protein